MEKIYSITELFNKYNLQYARGGKSSDKEKYLKSVGIIIQEVPNNFKKKKTYKVIDDSLFTSKEWTRHPTKNLELTKKGQVRNSNNKVIYTPRLTTNGYVQIGDNLLHRLLMETFNPIFLEGYFTVDHINGIRTDNRLENLRWVTSSKNSQLMAEHQKQIHVKLQQLIQNRGYNYVLSLLDKEINS